MSSQHGFMADLNLLLLARCEQPYHKAIAELYLLSGLVDHGREVNSSWHFITILTILILQLRCHLPMLFWLMLSCPL